MKRVVPTLTLLLPYIYFTFFYKQAVSMIDQLGDWLWFFLGVLALDVVFVAWIVRRGAKPRFLLFWNMVIKIAYIPIYGIVLALGVLFFSLPGTFIFTPIFVAFDYTLLLLGSAFGIGALIQARREGKLSKIDAMVLGFLHLFFWVDVICAVIAYFNVRARENKLDKQQ